MTDQRKTGQRTKRARRVAAGLGAALALTAVPFAGSAAADTRDSDLVPGTPCTITTGACVALGENGFDATTWMIRNGEVQRGPMKATTGGPGKDTPTGTFEVLRKQRYNTSSETTNAEGLPSEMPWSVFFTASGMAFHGGGERSARTAGCIRLGDSDAAYVFNNLQPGDAVQVAPESAQRADGPDDSDDSGDGDGGLLGGLG